MGNLVYTIGVYLIIPLVLYMIKSHADRFKAIEEQVSLKLNDQQVRQIVMDKLDPLKDDIHEIRTDVRGMADKFDKIVDLLIQDK